MSLGFVQRLLLFVLVFALEWVPIARSVDTDRGTLPLFQLAIVCCSIFLGLGYARVRGSLQEITIEVEKAPIAWRFFGLHLLALVVFLVLSSWPRVQQTSTLQSHGFGALWYATGILVIVMAWCALIPLQLTLQFIRLTGYTWVYAIGFGLVAWRFARYAELSNGEVWNPAETFSWKPATDFTFTLVSAFLHLFTSDVVADRATMTLGTPQFSVEIFPVCAGFEGMALMFVFSVAWLWFLRREFRFPQAFLLVPIGMSVMWITNAVRITALILIGAAGASRVATGGFHSEAGWIAFNCLALTLAVVSLRLPWFSRKAHLPSATSVGDNPTAVYLMPFLTILAAAMISRAASGEFEWLYPLRFIAAFAVLWSFRKKYRELDWRFGWHSVITGVAVFVIWLAIERFAPAGAGEELAAGLASFSPPARIAWLLFRVAAAIVVVPLAEELAFRAFLIRRLLSADFENLDPRRYTYFSVLVSSLAFGFLHGERWIAGTIAGVLYSVVYLRRGSIGDAVVAHSVTNALLAAIVLYGGYWNLW